MTKEITNTSIEEENEILVAEFRRLVKEKEEEAKREEEGGPIKKVFSKIFGPLIYDGPENCCHCKFWKPNYRLMLVRSELFGYYNKKTSDLAEKGDCKLLFDKENTKKDDTCHRFTPRWRYFRRVKTWRKQA